MKHLVAHSDRESRGNCTKAHLRRRRVSGFDDVRMPLFFADDVVYFVSDRTVNSDMHSSGLPSLTRRDVIDLVHSWKKEVDW